MSRRGWIILLVLLGIVGTVALGIYAVSKEDSQANAQAAFCSSLSSLESDIDALLALDPTTASKDDYENAVDAIEDDWDDVKSDASDLASIDMNTLESAWDDFESAVKGVSDDSSVSDALDAVKTAAQSFASTVKSTLAGPDCSTS